MPGAMTFFISRDDTRYFYISDFAYFFCLFGFHIGAYEERLLLDSYFNVIYCRASISLIWGDKKIIMRRY